MATILHDSDCAVHNEPAYPNGPCDCYADALMEVHEKLKVGTHAKPDHDKHEALVRTIARLQKL